jgi:hypothetical protein
MNSTVIRTDEGDMKLNVALLLPVLISASQNQAAQRGGAGGAGRGMGHSGIGIRSGFSHHNGGRWDYRRGYDYYNGYSDFGWADPDYWDSSLRPNEDYAPQPVGILLMPALHQPAPEDPPPPPPLPTPALHEYSWPNSADESGAVFSIASKNGQIQSASTIWVQDDRLRFVKPDGGGGRLLLSEVDLQSTTRINSEKKLKLRLPTQD